MNERSQQIILIWGLIFMYIFGLSFWGLLKMMPPPDANLSEAQVANFYLQHGFQIRVGAMISSWVSAFGIPIAVVSSIQLARLEKGTPVWSILSFAGGLMMSIFLVLPPLFLGVAAFTVERAPEVTAIMHELALLTLTTTDQYFIFYMAAMGIVSLSIKNHDSLSAYPRWFGYITLWIALVFEVGALAFMFKTGPFSWNGIFVYWFPLVFYGFWLTLLVVWFCIVLERQKQEKPSN